MIFIRFFAVFFDVARGLTWCNMHSTIGWQLTASILPNSAYLHSCSPADEILTTFLSRLKVVLLDLSDCSMQEDF